MSRGSKPKTDQSTLYTVPRPARVYVTSRRRSVFRSPTIVLPPTLEYTCRVRDGSPITFRKASSEFTKRQSNALLNLYMVFAGPSDLVNSTFLVRNVFLACQNFPSTSVWEGTSGMALGPTSTFFPGGSTGHPIFRPKVLSTLKKHHHHCPRILVKSVRCDRDSCPTRNGLDP